MPSGAKKRKAAKKKKEKEAAHHHHHHHHQEQPHTVDVHSHGDDDLKHHDDDKDSDAEEVSSPTSQEHPNNHHQEEVEKTEDGTYVQSSSEENKSFGGQTEDNQATQTEIEEDIEIEQELESDDTELNIKDTIVEDFEPPMEANGGVLLQSLEKGGVIQNETDSQLASDEVSRNNQIVDNVKPKKEGNDGVLLQSLDEGNFVQNETESKPDSDELNSKTAIVENVEPQKEGKGEVLLQSMEERSIVQNETDAKPANDEFSNKNAIVENVEPQKEANDGARLHSLEQGGLAQIEADLKTTDRPESKNLTVEPAVFLKESTDGDMLPSQNEESHVIDKKVVLVDNAQVFNSIQEVNSFSKDLSQLTNGSKVGDNHSSFVETKSVEEIEKIKLSNEKIYGCTSVSADSNWEMKENGGKETILQESNGRTPPTCVDLGPDNRGNEATVKRDSIVATSGAKISAREIGEKLTVSCNVTAPQTANGADSSNSTNHVEHLKDPEVSKSSEHQPLVPSAPRVVQRTSWMNCCGLFEVFAGSNR